MKLLSIAIVPNTKQEYKDGTCTYTLDLMYRGWLGKSKMVIMTPTGMGSFNKETDAVRFFCFADELGNDAGTELNTQLTNFCRTAIEPILGEQGVQDAK